MKIRKTKIENVDTTAMVKPGKPGLSKYAPMRCKDKKWMDGEIGIHSKWAHR